MSDVIGNTITSEVKDTVKEIKQQFGFQPSQQKKPSGHQLDPGFQQLAQQDKIESAQKEASIKRELAMMTHQNASSLGIIKERPQQHQEEVNTKPQLGELVVPGGKNGFSSMAGKLADTKRESKDMKSVG